MGRISFAISRENKRILINIANNRSYNIVHKYLILDLIETGIFDKKIKLIKKGKIDILKSPLVPKGYLTMHEQFLSVLDNFISYCVNTINSPEHTKQIVINCLRDSDIVLSKKYFFDNINIDYYSYNFKYLLSRIFYNNLIILKNSLSEELEEMHLDIDKIDLNKYSDVSLLTTLLGEISFLNRNSYMLISLFENVSDEKKELYIDWYKMLLQKHIKNIDFIQKYREFQHNN